MELLQDVGFRYQEAFGAEDCASAPMKAAVLRWLQLYYSRSDCLQLPYTIVRKLARAVFAEYQAEGPLRDSLPFKEAMELAMVAGECFLMPGTSAWRAVSRGDILVFARDSFGEPTDVGLMERSGKGRHCFTLLERRSLDEKGALTVTNRLFRSGSRGSLGREVSLSDHPLYADLPRQCTLPGDLGGLGLVRLKMPMVNCIDGSREGISIYAAAEALIRAAEENERQLQGEFRRGQSRLVVSRDMLREGQLKDDLFVGLDESPETLGITVFSPALREQSYLNRQQAYLRAVENVIGLKRGLLSQVEAVDRTATEITSSEGEYMGLIRELQSLWEHCAHRCAALQEALTGEPCPLKLHWGDGILNN